MNKTYKQTFVLILVLTSFTFINCFGQTDSLKQSSEKHKTRNIIWFTPSKADQINGITIGPFQSNLFFEKEQKINGISIEFVGAGLLLPLMPYEPFGKLLKDNKTASDSIVLLKLDTFIKTNKNPSIHNGLLISVAGSARDVINGLSVSAFCGGSSTLNGVSINPFMNLNGAINGIAIGAYNSAGKVRGLQIGLFNKAINLKGLQIGLWNRTRKRSLPFFNWG